MARTINAFLLLSLAFVCESQAHHSFAGFDFNERFIGTGTLIEFDWRNPHINLLVDVNGEEGLVERWLFEGPPPSIFRDGNIRRSNFENSINKVVTVEASRARDGSLSALIRQITLADGTLVVMCPEEC